MIRMLRDVAPILSVFRGGPRGKLLAGLFLSIATVLSGLALLGLSGWFITATAIAGVSAATALTFDVFAPSAGIRFFALARTASRYGEQLVTHDATLGVLAELRERLFRGSAEMREAEKLRMRPSRLLFRLTQDIDALDSVYLRVIVPIVSAIGAGLAVAIAFGVVQPLAGLASAIFLIAVSIGILVVCARAARPAVRQRTAALEALRAQTIDLVSGQTDLIMAGRLSAHRRALIDTDKDLCDADDRINLIEVASGAAFGIASAAFVSFALYFVLTHAHGGHLSVPLATLVVLVAISALEPFTALRRGAIELGRTLVAAHRVAPRISGPSPSHVTSPALGYACSLETVRFCYARTARPVVENFSLAIRRNEHVALIGASGSAKSTILSLVAGELQPDHGTVRSLPATLFTQRTELFVDTIRDNLLLADPGADDATLMDFLGEAGLRPCFDALPQGFDTRVGEGGLGLSGGEARRLALARLFLRETPLWLLDEPTEGLDQDTASDILVRLKHRAISRALLIATHIRREAEIADRLILMQNGCIIRSAMRGEPAFETLLASLRHV